jgi:hypothetical protein
MNKSRYNNAYPIIRGLSYIFLACGIILFCLEIVVFFRSKDYSIVDASNKYFMASIQFVWYFGLRYLNKEYINKQES